MANKTILFCKEEPFKKAETILDSITPDQENKLTEKLVQVYDSFVSTDEQLAESEEFLHQMSDVVKKKFPQCELHFYGSRENGFFTKESDLDITVIFTFRQTFSRGKLIEHLTMIFECLNDWKPIELEQVFSAKLPIVRFKKNKFSGDISVNNVRALKNTNLLRFYSEFEPVVQKLGLLLKFAVNRSQINNVRTRTLSTYAYMIMLIYYLQKKNILPVIQELSKDNRFFPYDEWHRRNKSIIKSSRTDRSIKSLSELWIGFLKYYTMEFDLSSVVSIRKSHHLQKPHNWRLSSLAIEDPIDTAVNLGIHLRNDRHVLILKSFYNMLLAKGDVFQLTDNSGLQFCIPDSSTDVHSDSSFNYDWQTISDYHEILDYDDDNQYYVDSDCDSDFLFY